MNRIVPNWNSGTRQLQHASQFGTRGGTCLGVGSRAYIYIDVTVPPSRAFRIPDFGALGSSLRCLARHPAPGYACRKRSSSAKPKDSPVVFMLKLWPEQPIDPSTVRWTTRIRPLFLVILTPASIFLRMTLQVFQWRQSISGR